MLAQVIDYSRSLFLEAFVSEKEDYWQCSEVNRLAVRFCNNLSQMRIGDLTQKQLSSVPCPMCGVPVGHRCILQAGGLRKETHTDRRLIAVEAIERNRERRQRPQKCKGLGLEKKKRLLMARYAENPVNARLALEIASLNRDLARLGRG
jgi:hypothetical protein